MAGSVNAKIDRLDQTVRFTPLQQAVDVLTEWSGDVTRLMSLIHNTTHLINKERMLHRV